MPVPTRPATVNDASGSSVSRATASKIVLLIALAACLCLALLALLQSLADVQLRQVFLGPWTLPALALHFTSLAMFVLAWQQLLAGYSLHRFRYRECVAQVGVTLTGKYLPGKIWGLLGRSYLLTRRKMSRGSALHLLVADQFLTFYSGFIAIGLAALLIVSPLAAGFAAIATAALTPWCLGYYQRLSSWLASLPLVRRRTRGINADPLTIDESSAKRGSSGAGPGESPEDNTRHDLRSSTLTRVVLVYTLHWVGLALALAILFYPALAINLWLNSLLLVIAVPAGMLSGFLAFWAPGGIGVREAVMVSVLSINTSLELAVVIAIAYRLLCIGNDLLTGLFALHYYTRNDPSLFQPTNTANMGNSE